MFEFKWSPSEKKAARAAFDLALDRELKAIRQEALTAEIGRRVVDLACA